MYPRSLYNLPSKSSVRNLKNFQFQKKLMEIYIYIFFLIALPNTEKFYTLFIFHFVHKSSLVRTICAKIFKISKISNFSPNFTLYPSLSCNLAWFILPQAFLTKAHVYFAYNTACVIPPLPFFFYIQIYDSYSPTRFMISTRLSRHIFVTNAYVWYAMWFFRINWQYICKFLRNKDPTL